MAEPSYSGSSRSCRGLHGPLVRGHEPMRNPRQESNNHAEGHPVGQADTRYLGGPWLTTDDNAKGKRKRHWDS